MTVRSGLHAAPGVVFEGAPLRGEPLKAPYLRNLDDFQALRNFA